MHISCACLLCMQPPLPPLRARAAHTTTTSTPPAAPTTHQLHFPLSPSPPWGAGVGAAAARVCGERRSRDVYVVGAANVGKSAFVRALLKEVAKFDPAASSMGK